MGDGREWAGVFGGGRHAVERTTFQCPGCKQTWPERANCAKCGGKLCETCCDAAKKARPAPAAKEEP